MQVLYCSACSVCVCVGQKTHCGRRPVHRPETPTRRSPSAEPISLPLAVRPQTCLPPRITDYQSSWWSGPLSRPPLERRTPVHADPPLDGLLKARVLDRTLVLPSLSCHIPRPASHPRNRSRHVLSESSTMVHFWNQYEIAPPTSDGPSGGAPALHWP